MHVSVPSMPTVAVSRSDITAQPSLLRQAYTQSSAVLRHAARKGGLMPADEELQYQVCHHCSCSTVPGRTRSQLIRRRAGGQHHLGC